MSDRLAEIQERVRAATPGPWEAREGDVWAHGYCLLNNGFQYAREADADFIARSREDVEYLLRVAEAATQLRRDFEFGPARFALIEALAFDAAPASNPDREQEET